MTRRQRTIVRLTFWGGSIAAVLMVGLVFFPREYPGLKFYETLYAILRIFVFERDLDAFPRSWPLIIIYFAAPVISLSALGTLISYLFRLSPSLKTMCASDHVVVCGMGRIGKVIASACKSRSIAVVGIDIGPREEFEEWSSEKGIPIISGDFHSRVLLEKAGARRARSLIFASGDDLANLEGAIALYDWLQTDKGVVRLIWVHIADERLADTARAAVRTKGVVGIRFFDTYWLAATLMVRRYFHRERRAGVREILILGFGKFGRDLFETLIRNLTPEENMVIRIVDRADRRREILLLAGTLGVSDRVIFERAVIQELSLQDADDKAFFICTDDDLGNLTVAFQLSMRANCNHIYVRMTRWPISAVAENLGDNRGVVFVNINELVTLGIADLPGVSRPASAEDLKRVKGGS